MTVKVECKKKGFPTETSAEEFILRIKRSGHTPRERTTYYCLYCQCWHITSQENKYRKKIKELEAEIKQLKDENQKELLLKIGVDLRVKRLLELLQEKGDRNAQLKKDNQRLVNELYVLKNKCTQI